MTARFRVDELVLRFVLWGEHPDRAAEQFEDWASHLDDFGRDHSAGAFLWELVKGAASHVLFRLGRPRAGSTIGLAVAILAGFVVTLVMLGPISAFLRFSWLAEVHMLTALGIFLVAVMREASSFKSNRLRLFAFVYLAAGYSHLAISMEPIAGGRLLFLSYLLTSVSFLAIAFSAARGGSILGAASWPMLLLAGSMMLNIVGYFWLAGQLGLPNDVRLLLIINSLPKVFGVWAGVRVLFSSREEASKNRSTVAAS